MEVKETFWEKRNIGVNSCEILIADSDDDKDVLNHIENVKNYQYLVAKLPVCRTKLLMDLEDIGWRYIENQFILENDLEDFKVEKINSTLKLNMQKTYYAEMTAVEIEDLYEELEKNIFTTDRIFLDPHFEKKCSVSRYVNWIKDLVSLGVVPYKVVYDGTCIGFFIFENKITSSCNSAHLILAGLYKEFIGHGLGVLMEISALKYAKEFGATKVETCCSSNNIPVLKVMFSINYKLKTLNTVVVKHNL